MASKTPPMLSRLSRRIERTLRSALRGLIKLDRRAKRALVLGADAVLCVIAVWLAFSLRTGTWILFDPPILAFISAALLFFPPVFVLTGTYRHIFRFAGSGTIAQLAVAVGVTCLLLALLFTLVGVAGVPRTLAFIHAMLFFGLLAISRITARYLLLDIAHGVGPTTKRVLVYGASGAGRQLSASLRNDPHFELFGILDDDEHLHRQRLDSVKVYHASRIGELIDRHAIDTIFLALPDISRSQRNSIIQKLRSYRVHVLTLPSAHEIASGRVSISDVREIRIEDLLGRDPVPPNELLLGRTIVGKTVLVTGAGGSIGSELCRQIWQLRPARLILVEMSEPALFEIDKELREKAGAAGGVADIVPELVNMADSPAARRLFARYSPDTVFHAAAYKHVPLLERNVLSGLRNNVLATRNAAAGALMCGTKHFILVSTDKAVRPTNVMGASKRVCELILQAKAQRSPTTRFSMVRFGNVLGSSGSVVPQFRRQIEQGGPIRLTHRDITRYFMTIPEAAQLVIQAGALANGGEVFLLDMGKPVRILDLARTMIELAGREVRDDNNPTGDIEIVEVGLRPGEKLYEELLIDEEARPTRHSMIMEARESFTNADALDPLLVALETALDDGDANRALGVLRTLVPEYRPSDGRAHPTSA